MFQGQPPAEMEANKTRRYLRFDLSSHKGEASGEDIRFYFYLRKGAASYLQSLALTRKRDGEYYKEYRAK